MSALTKIFIVLLVVFSIAFAMSTVSFVVQTSDWKRLAQEWQAQHKTTESHMVNLTASHAAEKANWLDARKEQLRRQGELETSLQAMQADLDRLKTELAQAKADKSSADGLVSNLTGQLQLASAARDNEQTQRETLASRNIELETRNLDLNERINEQTAQILVLVQQQRQQEQQINILRDENRKLASVSRRQAAGETDVNGTDAVTALEPVSSTPIRGRITEVSGRLVTISVGSSDGVQEAMVFVIYRGSEYIGDLKVTDVEPNAAAGTLQSTRGTPQVNDLVADENRFGTSGS